MSGVASLMEASLQTLGTASVHIDVGRDDFMLACSDSTFGSQVFDGMYNLCEWRTT